MDFLLVLLALVMGFLLHAAWQLTRTGKRHAGGRIPSKSRITIEGRPASPPAERKRRLQWISVSELRSILARNDDLVVIDLRPDGHRAAFPISSAQVLPVRTHELEEVLRWLPDDRSAAFYGASGLCVSIIESSGCTRGRAPLYVLKPERESTEAA
jgi:rhodanese-related sulfurtransferase